MLMFKLGDFKFQDFQRRTNVAVFGQLLLGLFDKVLHFIQLAACDAAMNGHAIKRNKGTAFFFSHRGSAFLYFYFLECSSLAISIFNASRAARTSPCSLKCCSAC